MTRYSSLFLPRWALVVLLLASAMRAADPLPFTLRFGASGAVNILMDRGDDPDNRKTFELGFREGALAGYDPRPPGFDIGKPPFGDVSPNLYFPVSHDIGGLSQDFRPPVASESWQLELVNMQPGQSVTLSWGLLADGGLAGNVLSLKDRVSGVVLVANMTASGSSSYQFTSSRSLLVVYGAPIPDIPTPGTPSGLFDLVFQNDTSGVLRHVWDLTGGPYTATIGADTLTLTLVHGESGTLTGVATLTGAIGTKQFAATGMPIKGSCSGKNGSLTVRGSMAGTYGTTSVSLNLSLALVGRTLTGVATGKVSDTAGTRRTVNSRCVFNLPEAIGSTYRLPTELTLGARGAVTGTSTLTLASGRPVRLLVAGKRSGQLTTLQLTGNKALNPASTAITFKLTIQTFTNGTASIRTLAGKAFGQVLSWHP